VESNSAASTSQSPSSADTAIGTGPGGTHAGRNVIGIVVAAIVALAILDMYSLMKVWPHPTPSGGPQTAARPSGQPPLRPDSIAPNVPNAGLAQAKSDSTKKGDSAKAAQRTAVRGVPGALHCDTLVTPHAYALSPSDSMYDPECVSIAGREFPLWAEQRLLLIVILSGILGGLVHAIRSLGWYIGNRELVRSWLPYYALLPLTGAMIAVAFYLVIRGGFFSPSGSFRDTSPFGFAAMSVLVGMFSTPAALKLQQLAETMLTKPEGGKDSKPQAAEPVGAPSANKSAAPQPVPAAEAHPANEQGGLPRAGNPIAPAQHG
jgi:hypothetical protein